jgi:hypothetical protein
MPKRRALTHADVRTMALGMPEAHESSHMGIPDFRVRKKIFATIPPMSPGDVVLKMAPANVDALVRRDPGIFRDAWRGRWVGIELAQISRGELGELIADAWRFTAPKSLVKVHGKALSRA